MGNAVVIFPKVKGVTVEQLVARHVKVQSRLDAEAFKGFVRAKDKLSVVKARNTAESIDRRTGAVEGKSEILPVAEGAIDRYVILSDERGDGAALAIELGRSAYEARPGQEIFSVENPNGGPRLVPGHPGAFVLTRAFGLKPGQLSGTGGGGDVLANGLIKSGRFRKERIE